MIFNGNYIVNTFIYIIYQCCGSGSVWIRSFWVNRIRNTVMCTLYSVHMYHQDKFCLNLPGLQIMNTYIV